MDHFYNILAAQFSWLTDNASDDHKNVHQTFPTGEYCDPFLITIFSHGESLTPISQYPSWDQTNVVQPNEADNDVETEERRTRVELSHESDEKGIVGNWITKAKKEDDNIVDTVTYDEIDARSEDEFSTLTEQSEIPEYPVLKEVKWTDIKLAIKAGAMPRLCTWCLRWEDQPEDKYEEKDMVPDKCFMLGNKVFFRKRKPFWTECEFCGFGLPKRAIRGTKTSRLKKLFCKLTGKKYTGSQFVPDGYDWYQMQINEDGDRTRQ